MNLVSIIDKLIESLKDIKKKLIKCVLPSK